MADLGQAIVVCRYVRLLLSLAIDFPGQILELSEACLVEIVDCALVRRPLLGGFLRRCILVHELLVFY